MERSFTIPISRRDLLKLAGVTAVGAVLSGKHEVEAAEKISGDTISYNGKKIPVLYSVDVCICGGGPSGTAAAVNSAKNGAKTLLIERGIALGGLGVLGCVYPFMDTHAPDSDTPYLVELKNRLRGKGIEPFDGVTQQTWHNPEILAEIHDEMCEENRVKILYQTDFKITLLIIISNSIIFIKLKWLALSFFIREAQNFFFCWNCTSFANKKRDF